jgi:DMSO/TMAO reductase YedYZ molybdopterin-dependent catalytic subunit
MEVAGKSRCHGMHLEGLAYPITPIGMHYLLIHYDIPEIDEKTYQVKVDGRVKNKLTLDMDYFRSPAEGHHNGHDGMLRQRPSEPEMASLGPRPLEPRRDRDRRVDGHAAAWGCSRKPAWKTMRWRSCSPGRTKASRAPPDGAQVQYFQRSLTVDYVMNPDNDVLLCYEINGVPLPPQHGYPLRLLVPGWLGMANVKWIDSIEATSTRLTERQMKWYSYAQNDNDPNRQPATFQQTRAMMIPPGIPDFLCRIRHLEETSAVELRGRAWAGGLRIDSVEVSLDGGNNWSYAKLDKPMGNWAWVGWSFTWEDVTPGEYTLRCRAKDERGNMSKDDDSEHDYYAMDITKAQYVDVNVYPKGTLAPLNKIELPVQFPSL